jgi:hypothetical protein
MTKLLRTGTLSDGENGFAVIETSEGPLEIRFTYEDAERLIAELHSARGKIQAERVHSAQPPIPDKPKAGTTWETAIDPVNQEAVIRTHLPDRTTQDTRIPRSEIGAIAAFLEQAAKRFDASADMRQ